MKIAIIGTGAMGSLFAALLSTVADIVMIGHWAQQLEAVREHGLMLRRLDGDQSQHRIAVTSLPEEAFPAECALVLVKGWQTPVAAQLAQSVLAPHGLAITLQNGLGNLEILAKAVGSERAVLGVTSEGAMLLAPGLVRHAGRGQTIMAASESTKGRIEDIAALFSQAGLDASVVDDAQSVIWGKLAVNAAINPLTALLQVPNGWLLQERYTLDIMNQAAEEVSRVANRLGVTLPFDDAAAQALKVARATAENRSSMAQDIARGTPTEIEQICGAVVRSGRSVDVATPVNEALLHLVRTQIALGDWRHAIDVVAPELRRVFRELSTLEIQK